MGADKRTVTGRRFEEREEGPSSGMRSGGPRTHSGCLTSV